MGKVTETKTSYKTTGGNDVPNVGPVASGATVSPAHNADTASHTRYVHDGIDVTGFKGVSQDYQTFADARNKPL